LHLPLFILLLDNSIIYPALMKIANLLYFT
jgi:hypothetical protein